jgi:hypothetical protein
MERCGSFEWKAGSHGDTAGSGVTRQAMRALDRLNVFVEEGAW